MWWKKWLNTSFKDTVIQPPHIILSEFVIDVDQK